MLPTNSTPGPALAPAIRNIVFDIGNVLVRWDSRAIVESAFGVTGDAAHSRWQTLFIDADIWRALNRGEYSEAGAKAAFVEAGHMTADEAEAFFDAIYESLYLLEDTPPLMERLRAGGYRLFALTDNVREIVEFLSRQHSWWEMFDGVTNSAEVGCLKPDPRMYANVLEANGLDPAETVFLDDMPGNVAGAQAAGMHAFVFTSAAQAERDLRSLGVSL